MRGPDIDSRPTPADIEAAYALQDLSREVEEMFQTGPGDFSLPAYPAYHLDTQPPLEDRKLPAAPKVMSETEIAVLGSTAKAEALEVSDWSDSTSGL